MEKEPTIDDLRNKLIFLKQALLYYGDETNYNPNNPNIMLDMGHQARFALKQIEFIDNYNKNIIEDATKIIMDEKEKNITIDQMLNDIEKLKKIYDSL